MRGKSDADLIKAACILRTNNGSQGGPNNVVMNFQLRGVGSRRVDQEKKLGLKFETVTGRRACMHAGRV